MKIGDKLKGKITGIQPYGAFVELENGTIGLIHISEIRPGYIENIHDSVKVGQQVLVQVVDYDEFSGKSSLSMRTLEEEKHRLPRRHRFSNDRCKIGFEPLGRQLPIWIKEAKKFLKENNVEFIDRHIVEENPSKEELLKWMDMSGLETKKFFNTSGKLYKEMNLKDRVKNITKEEAAELLSTNGMLVKRPILINGDKVLVGFKEDLYREIL